MNGLCAMVHLFRLIIDGLPEPVKHHQPQFDKAVKGYKTGIYSTTSTFSRESHDSNGKDWTIPRNVEEPLRSGTEEYLWLQSHLPDLVGRCEIFRCEKVVWQARTFRPSQDTPTTADGHIRYRSSSQLTYGEITSIFALYSWSEGKKSFEGLFFAVQPYEQLLVDEAEANPFKRYPDAGIHLIPDLLRQTPVLVRPENIISHIVVSSMDLALSGVQRPYLAVIAVDEVSYAYIKSTSIQI